MKKLFTLFSLLLCTLAANAQKISWTADDVASASADVFNGKVFSNGDFSLAITDSVGKFSIDANNCYFGTADEYIKYEYRLKTGGKSIAKNKITLSVPSKGTLLISVRTGSNSATDRNLVISQGEETLFDQIIKEEGSYVEVKGLNSSDPEKVTNIYNVISIPVEAGTVNVAYPVNSLNFYAFEFIAGEEENSAMLLSKQNIVAEYETTLTFIEGKQYEGKTDTIAVADIYEKLGLSSEALPEGGSINDYVYAQKVDTTSANDIITYSLSDTLTVSLFKTDGWFGRYSNYDEATDTETLLDINAPKSFGAACTFYIQDPVLVENDLMFTYGQYPGTLQEGDTDYTYIYVINGDKAARIKVTVNVEKAPTINPDERVLAGENTIEVKANPMGGYGTVQFTVDMDAVATALGCSVSDIDDVWSWAAGGTMSNDHTENSGGFYFNADGTIGSWASSVDTTAPYFISINSLPDGSFNMGQYPGAFDNIESDVTAAFDLIFCYEANYYIAHVQFTITKDKLIDDDTWERVYSEDHNVQVVKAEGYGQKTDGDTQLDMEAIIAAVGTDKPVLYGEKYTKDETSGEETVEFSKVYSCDPHPGFWMSEDGRSVSNWGTSCAYGMTYTASTGIFHYYVHPETTHVTGDEFETRFFLVNEETGKYAQISLTVVYVDERGAVVSEVGSSDVKIILTDENLNEEALYEGNEGVDWADVFEKLGITAADIPDCQWMIQSPSGKLVNIPTGTSFEGEDCLMSADGLSVSNIEDAAFAIGFNNDTQKFTISTLGNEPVDGVVYSTRVALKSDKGYYVFNVKAGVTIEDKKPGDVDGSGKVDISDVVAIINTIAGIKIWENADVDGSGKVDITDVVKVINIIAGGGE